MAFYTAAGGPIYLASDMNAMEREFARYDSMAWEIAKDFYTESQPATKVLASFDKHVPDIKIDNTASDWYEEINTNVGGSEILLTRKTFGANGNNTRNIKLTLKGNFKLVSGVVLDDESTVNEMIEIHEVLGRPNRSYTTSLKNISIRYDKLLDYYSRSGGNLATLLFDGNDDIEADNSGTNPTQFVLRGFNGNDKLEGSDRMDSLAGDNGNDRLSGKKGNDYLDGGSGADTLFGNEGRDLILGGDGNDQIFGGLDDDVINGGAGADRLDGNKGDDRLTGGRGADAFVLSAGDDIITDFRTAEKDRLLIGKGDTYTLKQDNLGQVVIERKAGTTTLLGVLLNSFDPKSSFTEL